MKTLKIFLALLFLFLLSTQDGYSWERKKTLKELTNSAPLIVYGKVLEVIPKYEEYVGQKDFIITYVKFSVQTFFKGTGSEQILTIKVTGGQIGDKVIGGERSFPFTKNEEALLFLSPTENNFYEVYSISGKLTSVDKNEGKYLDCSLLKDDDVSKYEPDSLIKSEKIISRINGYLDLKGGK